MLLITLLQTANKQKQAEGGCQRRRSHQDILRTTSNTTVLGKLLIMFYG